MEATTQGVAFPSKYFMEQQRDLLGGAHLLAKQTIIIIMVANHEE